MGKVALPPPPAAEGAILGRKWPRIMSLYLLRDFLSYFGVALVGLVTVLTIGTVFDSMRVILRNDPGFWMFIAYYACRVPYNIAASIPLAVLIATLLTVANMLKSHELVAMRASGMSQYAISMPMLAAALVISLLTFGFTETVLPWANGMARTIKWVHIKKIPPEQAKIVPKAAIWTSGGNLVYATEANGEEGVLKGVSILEFRGGELVGRVDAPIVKPVKGMWELMDAQVYRWRGGKPSLTMPSRARYPLLEGMGDFLQENTPVENMTRSDLRAVIEKLKKGGKEYGAEQVFYYFKLAFPFASLIMVLLGLGVSFSFQTNPRSGIAATFGVAVVSAMGYLALVQVGQVLGVGGVLPPLVAVWMANSVFLVVGLVLLWKAWRN